jgi:hypothetical protein
MSTLSPLWAHLWHAVVYKNLGVPGIQVILFFPFHLPLAPPVTVAAQCALKTTNTRHWCRFSELCKPTVSTSISHSFSNILLSHHAFSQFMGGFLDLCPVIAHFAGCTCATGATMWCEFYSWTSHSLLF